MADLYDELEFPQRAEYLDQYKNYQVDIAHWQQLSAQFQRAFRQVYSRRSAAVLLVHGPQGSGKSMFCNRLEQDYVRSRAGAFYAKRSSVIQPCWSRSRERVELCVSPKDFAAARRSGRAAPLPPK